VVVSIPRVSAICTGARGNRLAAGSVGINMALRSRSACVAIAASAAVALGGCSSASRHAATTTLPSRSPIQSTSTSISPPSPEGVCSHEGQAVTGALRMVGGPSGAKIVPVSGIVTADAATTGAIGPTGPTGSGCHATAGSDGRFSLVLGPGSYVLSGRSPQFDGGTVDCNAERTVVLRPHPLKSTPAAIVVNVDCQRR
jgi:hypothetical protein